MSTITGNDIGEMVQHWLGTPVNAYLGSDYGQDLKAILQLPLEAIGSSEANAVLAKLRRDVPVLDVLPPGAVNLYGVTTPPDRTDIVIEVSGQAISASGVG